MISAVKRIVSAKNFFLKMKSSFLLVGALILNILWSKSFVEPKFFSVSIARERLLSDLFVNYNPASRPALKGERIDVTVNIELQHFDFRESDGAFNMVGFFNAAWRDKKLTWNPSDYNNITELAINQRLVWIPDLEMYNNAPDKFLRLQRNGFVVLEHTGMMTLSIVIELTIFCSTNMRYWPRDQHICHLVLGSWVYDGFDLDIRNDRNTTLSFDDEHVKNMVYEITNYGAERVETKYSCCEEPYISMNYVIEFKRRSGYATVLYTPVYVVVILTLLALAMKPNRGEKILLNGINFVLIIYQLLFFTQSIGKFARGTPHIVVFYSCSLVITTFAHLICVFSLWTCRSLHKGKDLPPIISNFLKGSFAQFIVSNRFSNEKSDCSSLIDQPSEGSPDEWVHLATFLERFAIIFFSFLYFLLTTLYLA